VLGRLILYSPVVCSVNYHNSSEYAQEDLVSNCYGGTALSLETQNEIRNLIV
jgi:hypothetical protein